MQIKYKIEDKTHAVYIYYDGDDVASLYQPHWPNGDAWSSAEEAEEWALLHIASIEDENAPYAPSGLNEPGIAKPTPEEIKEMEIIKKRIMG